MSNSQNSVTIGQLNSNGNLHIIATLDNHELKLPSVIFTRLVQQTLATLQQHSKANLVALVRQDAPGIEFVGSATCDDAEELKIFDFDIAYRDYVSISRECRENAIVDTNITYVCKQEDYQQAIEFSDGDEEEAFNALRQHDLLIQIEKSVEVDEVNSVFESSINFHISKEANSAASLTME